MQTLDLVASLTFWITLAILVGSCIIYYGAWGFVAAIEYLADDPWRVLPWVFGVLLVVSGGWSLARYIYENGPDSRLTPLTAEAPP